jgi:hypothetical protein
MRPAEETIMANYDDDSQTPPKPATAGAEGPVEPGLKDIVRSVLSAAIGVQSRRNQERDFTHGKARVYIIAGIIFTLLFIATVVSVVTVVLKTQG